MIEVFNTDMLVKIELHDRKKCNEFIYRIFEKKYSGFKTLKGLWNYFNYSFWWKDKMAGFYTDCYYYSDEDIRNGKFMNIPLLVCYDSYPCVYFHPYVKLSFAGGYTKIKEFDTYKEAVLFANIQEATIKNKITFFRDDI